MKKIISCTISEENLLYLKQRGISRSRLLTQAVNAVRNEAFEYNYVEVEE